MRYAIRPLDASTWAAFAELAERNNGIFGGCCCMGYHPEVSRTDAAQNRAGKERRVQEGRAPAALVIDEGGSAQGWCQYGSPGELPGIRHKREYEKDPPPPPDRRITCLFVDKKHRGQGIERMPGIALEGQVSCLWSNFVNGIKHMPVAIGGGGQRLVGWPEWRFKTPRSVLRHRQSIAASESQQ
jgi:hypothetical protein